MAADQDTASQDQRERLLWVLSAATFLIFFQRAGKRLKPWWVSSAKIRHRCSLQRSCAKEGSYASPLARRHAVHTCGFGSGRQRLCCLWRGSPHLRSPSAPHFYAARTCGGGVQMSPLLGPPLCRAYQDA